MLKTRMTASDMAYLRWQGDAPSVNFARAFPDSDPALLAAVEQWHAARKALDAADDKIVELARAEGWEPTGAV